jgi:hypothetical protein
MDPRIDKEATKEPQRDSSRSDWVAGFFQLFSLQISTLWWSLGSVYFGHRKAKQTVRMPISLLSLWKLVLFWR